MVRHRGFVLHEHLKRAGSSQLPGSPAELSQAECRCLGGALGGMTASRVSACQLYLTIKLSLPQRDKQADDCSCMTFAAVHKGCVVHV